MEETVMYMAIAFTIVMFAEVIIFMFFRKRTTQLEQLKDPAQTMHAKATITDRNIQHTKNGTSHYLHYRFKDWQGKECQTKRHVSEHIYQSVNQGDEVNITYLRSNPSISGFSDHLDEMITMARRIQQIFMISMLTVPLMLGAMLFIMLGQ